MKNFDFIVTGLFYYAIQDVPIGILITDTAYWAVGDTRNAKVVQLATQFILYTLYQRLNGVDIPQYLQIVQIVCVVRASEDVLVRPERYNSCAVRM